MHAARGISLLVLAPMLLLLSTANAASPFQNYTSVNTTSYSNQSVANATIINDINYVNLINRSSYLLISPNLTEAYQDLNKSFLSYNRSIATAVAYAQNANQSAEEAYLKIGSYKYYSAVAVLVYTALIGVLLKVYMRPIRKKSTKTNSTK